MADRGPFVSDGKTLYKIDVSQERTVTLWVLATSREEAEADADVLAASLRRDGDWQHIEDHVWTDVARSQPDVTELVWTGGPDGADVWWGDLRA